MASCSSSLPYIKRQGQARCLQAPQGLPRGTASSLKPCAREGSRHPPGAVPSALPTPLPVPWGTGFRNVAGLHHEPPALTSAYTLMMAVVGILRAASALHNPCSNWNMASSKPEFRCGCRKGKLSLNNREFKKSVECNQHTALGVSHPTRRGRLAAPPRRLSKLFRLTSVT